MRQQHHSFHRYHQLVSIPQQGYPLCGTITWFSYVDDFDGFNTAAGLPPLRQSSNELIRVKSEVSIPQQGYPLCGKYLLIDDLVVCLFQYRSRVTPFAASVTPEEFAKTSEFQYRSRVTPFAALHGMGYRPGDQKFQYRSRVTPFAAARKSDIVKTYFHVSIPQQGYPLCGGPTERRRRTFNRVSIPQQGYPLCGSILG